MKLRAPALFNGQHKFYATDTHAFEAKKCGVIASLKNASKAFKIKTHIHREWRWPSLICIANCSCDLSSFNLNGFECVAYTSLLHIQRPHGMSEWRTQWNWTEFENLMRLSVRACVCVFYLFQKVLCIHSVVGYLYLCNGYDCVNW